METIERCIEVEAPLQTVYNQWTQFEKFPDFMEGIQSVEQLDDKHLHWVAKVAGQTREWDSEIVEQIPDERIAWKSTTGAENSGVVHFRPKDHTHTLVTLRMNYELESVLEKAGDALGVISRRVEGDLERFRNFIQKQQTETGAWRGRIHRSRVESSGQIPGQPRSEADVNEYGSGGQSGLP